MIRFLSRAKIESLHQRVLQQSGGGDSIRDEGALESAIAQPQMTFGGEELYPTLFAKAAALGYFLVCNHPFVDGNKRIGHAALETFLVLNGYELSASVDEQESVFLKLASGGYRIGEFVDWVMACVTPVRP